MDHSLIGLNSSYHSPNTPPYPLKNEQLAYCSADERASLASYFLGLGELALLQGDLNGLEFFDQATELDSCNPELFYRQGLSLFEYGSEEGKEKALLLAGKKFKTATNLCPEYFEVWLAWGNALSLLGMTYQEHHYFLEAEEKLKKAISFSSKQPPYIIAELFWDYGTISSHIAEHSEEASDWQLAIQSFQKAAESQENLPAEFWIDFGKACLKMSGQINDIRLNIKAIHCFKHAVSLSISFYRGWTLLAEALEMLYEHTHDEDHFTQTNECFAAAAQLKPFDHELWNKWARFLCESGRRTEDVKRLKICLEKCQQSYTISPNQPKLLALWAESIALIGELSDRLDLIYEAQNKISQAIEISEEEDPLIWYSYGMCLNSFGHYFGDIDYYYQAIEKFQYGLSINRTCDKHWHAIGTTYATIGALESAIDAYEKAVRFFKKAVELSPSSSYLFDYAHSLSSLGEIKRDQKMLEEATIYFEQALAIQKNAIYIHPEWLFQYASTLDLLGDFHEEESYYLKAIEIFSHVLMVDPDYSQIHHKLALASSHLGELSSEVDHFHRAIHHYRLANKHEEENDQIILDWGITLINLASHSNDEEEINLFYREAENKITQAAKLGNEQSFYHLGCLYSLLKQYERAMHFIEKAHECKSLPPIEEVLEDEWLDGLRSTSVFQDFLSFFGK